MKLECKCDECSDSHPFFCESIKKCVMHENQCPNDEIPKTKPDGYCNCDGDRILDVCGLCGGDGSSCLDCNGEVNGSAVIDDCGVCGGDGSSCAKDKRCGSCSKCLFSNGICADYDCKTCMLWSSNVCCHD